jgi:epoxyqueuosine reductase
MRRIGYAQWQRNLAVGLGNSEGGEDVVQALTQALGRVNNMVDEHIEWALSQLTSP